MNENAPIVIAVGLVGVMTLQVMTLYAVNRLRARLRNGRF